MAALSQSVWQPARARTASRSGRTTLDDGTTEMEAMEATELMSSGSNGAVSPTSGRKLKGDFPIAITLAEHLITSATGFTGGDTSINCAVISSELNVDVVQLSTWPRGSGPST